MIREEFACPPQIISSPIWILQEVICWRRPIGMALDVWLERVRRSDYAADLLSYRRSSMLDLGYPGKLVALVKLALRQAWKVEHRRLLQEQLRTPEQ